MPPRVNYPGVYIYEIRSAVRTITGVATSITAFIGWAPTAPPGATNAAARVLSWEDYVRQFGGLHPLSQMSYAVYHFFNNGGQDAYIVPVVPAADAAKPTPAKVTLGKLVVSAQASGVAGNEYGIVITVPPPPPAAGAAGGVPPASSAGSAKFGLQVVHFTQADKKKWDILESFVNLVMKAGEPRSVETIVNTQSALVSAKVEDPTADHPPATADGEASPLLSGSNGKVGNANDLATAIVPVGATGGYHALEHVDLFNLLCVPGLTDPASLSILEEFCRTRRAFLIVDCPADATFDTMQHGPDGTLTGADGINAAFYFPWVQAPDPLANNASTFFPPSGFVAGVYAKTDTNRGVWKAPAGVEASLTGVLGVQVPLTDDENGVLNPQAINCIRNLPVYGTVVWGARTLEGNDQRGSEWKYIPVRRTALFIEETLYRNLKWVVFEPNDEPLWASIRLNVGAFMHNLFRQGAFQGQTPRDAYLVKCDKDTTTQDDINRGVVNILVGFAPLKPAEFVIVQIQQLAGQIPT